MVYGLDLSTLLYGYTKGLMVQDKNPDVRHKSQPEETSQAIRCDVDG
jgi:hypothetical protein